MCGFILVVSGLFSLQCVDFFVIAECEFILQCFEFFYLQCTDIFSLQCILINL